MFARQGSDIKTGHPIRKQRGRVRKIMLAAKTRCLSVRNIRKARQQVGRGQGPRQHVKIHAVDQKPTVFPGVPRADGPAFHRQAVLPQRDAIGHPAQVSGHSELKISLIKRHVHSPVRGNDYWLIFI